VRIVRVRPDAATRRSHHHNSSWIKRHGGARTVSAALDRGGSAGLRTARPRL